MLENYGKGFKFNAKSALNTMKHNNTNNNSFGFALFLIGCLFLFSASLPGLTAS